MKALLVTIVALFLIGTEAQALKIDGKALESKQDLAGSKDHAMVGRMPDTWIVQYEAKEFDQMRIALGKSTAAQTFEKIDNVEGRVTRIGYALPPGRSSFEALRQYEAALQKAGFKRLYGCEGRACGPLFHQAFETLPGEQNDFYYYDLEEDSLHYAAWQLSRQKGDVSVMLVTFAPNEIRHVENSFAFRAIVSHLLHWQIY